MRLVYTRFEATTPVDFGELVPEDDVRRIFSASIRAITYWAMMWKWYFLFYAVLLAACLKLHIVLYSIVLLLGSTPLHAIAIDGYHMIVEMQRNIEKVQDGINSNNPLNATILRRAVVTLD